MEQWKNACWCSVLEPCSLPEVSASGHKDFTAQKKHIFMLIYIYIKWSIVFQSKNDRT